MLPINNQSVERVLVMYQFLVNKRFLARTAGDNESEHAEYVRRKTRTARESLVLPMSQEIKTP